MATEGRKVLTDRRRFLQMMGATGIAGAWNATISKALAIPANSLMRTIQDVQRIVILT